MKDVVSAAPAAATSSVKRSEPSRGSLVVIRPDGTEGDTFPLNETETVIGRDSGGPFGNDAYLSPRHASFRFSGATLSVRDEGSLNGIFIRIERDVPAELQDGAVFRIGQEIIRYEQVPPPDPRADNVEVMGSPNPGYLGRLCLIIGRETVGNSYPIPPDGLHLGRERGDIVFPDDGYVSGLHCRIHGEGGKVMLTDVGSSNGTFVRIRGERQLPNRSVLLMGQQLYRVEF